MAERTQTIAGSTFPMLLVLGACILALGCQGTIEDERGIKPLGEGAINPDGTPKASSPLAPHDGPEIPPDPACVAELFTPTPMRRLSQSQYSNTIRDLFGSTIDPIPASDLFPSNHNPGLSGFSNDASASAVSELGVEQISLATEVVVAQALMALDQVVPCEADNNELICIESFINEFTTRAWRGPLAADEIAFLRDDVFAATRTELNFEDSVAVLLGVILQSPRFLYMVEEGGELVGGMRHLTSYELASRLSYLFWDTMPDDELLALAAANALVDPEVLEAQAQRLVEDDRSHEVARRFMNEWLEIYHLAEMVKDDELFPDYDEQMREDLEAEFDAFIDHVLWESDGRLETLLTSNDAIVNDRIADYYGVNAAAATAENWVRVALDETRRAGIFTRGAFLAAHAAERRPSPIFRGVFVREKVFCQTLSEPPELVETQQMADDTLSTRERLSAHREDPSCAGCHNLMDPIGYTFEHYDAIGAYRTHEDNGHPVDASGELVLTDVDGSLYGTIELTESLMQSEEVTQCMALQWFRYASGRTESDGDVCSLEQLHDAFAESDYDIRELMIQVAVTDSFRYIPAES